MRNRVRMTEIPINATRSPFGGRIRLVQQVTEDLQDALAVADHLRRKAEGTLDEGIPHEEVRRLLGLRS